jgi:hypothetical protein
MKLVNNSTHLTEVRAQSRTNQLRMTHISEEFSLLNGGILSPEQGCKWDFLQRERYDWALAPQHTAKDVLGMGARGGRPLPPQECGGRDPETF